MSAAEEIKSRLDLVNYIQQYVPLKRAGRVYKACCPFHAEKTPSFVVNPDRQTWRCFGACAEGGDVFNFAMKQHGWTFSEALRELGKQVGVEVERQSPQQQAQAEHGDQLRGLLQVAADFYHELLLNGADSGAAAALDYAREKRGLTDATLRRFKIGYAPPGWSNLLDSLQQMGYTQELMLQAGLLSQNEAGRVYDRFRNRLMVPINDQRGRVVGFGARALDASDNPKYLNSPQTAVFDKSQLLFALDQARESIRVSETAIIVEGYMDAIQAHQAGFTNVVAQMGTAMTEAQISRLAPRLAKRIILALDADSAGQNATMRSLEVARGVLRADHAGRLSVDLRILQIPDAKDPDDLIRETPERWQPLVDAAVPLVDYVIEMETRTLPDQPTIQQLEAVASHLMPMLQMSSDALYTKDNIQKLILHWRRLLGSVLRIDERDLLAWAQKYRQPPVQSAAPSTPRTASRSSRTLPAAQTEEPPDLPPLDYSNTPPDDTDLLELGYTVLPAQPSVQPPTRAANPVVTGDSGLEAYCLRMLYQEPELLYGINRKFRELAGQNTALLAGPLAELGVDDFTHSDYRALLLALFAAQRQDDLEVRDFVQRYLEPALLHELAHLLMNEPDTVRLQLRDRFAEDFSVLWQQHQRYGQIDSAEKELLGKVLTLRLRRLERLGQDLRFLQSETDLEIQASVQQQVMLCIQARREIEAEQRRMTSLVRS